VFVSAGNAGIDENIAPTTSMIAVSATQQNDVKTSWSSYGSFVALSAPGAGIWTTSKGGIYQAWTGTSFSSPLAAGVAALMMAAQTSLDGSRIEQLMFSTALDLGAAGRDPLYGHGRVDAAAGVKAAATPAVTPDTQPPTSSIVAPLAGSTVSALVAVDVSASDNVGVTRVELRVNDTLVALDDAEPYFFSWNSAGVPNGMANLTATAYDFAGNAGSSATVAVNVANATTPVTEDTTAPLVTITNPSAGSVYGTVTVSVSASDNSGAAGISQTLYIDGALRAAGTGDSLAYSWNTRKVKAGIHTLQAVAKDAAGNISTTSVQVTASK
jgi:thermitase